MREHAHDGRALPGEPAVHRPAVDAPVRPPRGSADVLALQRSAGNQAVSALLARSPEPAKPKDEKASGARATLPGIGTISLLSVSFGGGGGGGKAGSVREIVVSSKVGEHSPKLFKASLDGQPMEVEVVLPSGTSALRLTLKGALVTSYSTSGQDEHAIESWTLNFESLEQSREGEPGE